MTSQAREVARRIISEADGTTEEWDDVVLARALLASDEARPSGDEAIEAAASLASQYALASYEHTCFVEFNDLAEAIRALTRPSAPAEDDEVRAIYERIKDTEAFPIGGRDFDVLLSFLEAALSSGRAV